jgi:cellulose biosynthesis protein BcsQ
MIMRVGTVVTFYSYKGGVGRSFALANVAAALAHWGHRVLCIDWDLDAPGLPFYFRLEKPTRGILELVFSIKDGSNPRWQEFVTSVDLPETSARLDLITAGLGDETYVDRVQRIDWANMYEQYGLDEWLECWRSQWKKDYDFVLVDSRTGVTDIGAICTVQLPDILVFLFTANKQSLEGAIEIVNRVQSARNKLQSDRSGILMVPVISRFDSTKEYKLAESWRTETIEPKIAEFYEPWIAKGVKASDIVGRTIIPYVPYWTIVPGFRFTLSGLRLLEKERVALFSRRLGGRIMIQRPMTMTQARRIANRLKDIIAGPDHGSVDVHPLGDPGGDSRGQGATRAVGMARVDARAFKHLRPPLADQYVIDLFPSEMSPFDQHGLGA